MYTHRLLPVVLAGIGAASAAAQQTIVSPAPASASVEGTQNNLFPWVTTAVCRYMQVHSDIGGGAPKIITKLAFRRNAASAPQTGTRVVDMELSMGESVDYDHVSYVFANNYLTPPVVVVPRQTITIGPMVTPGNPAPFEVVVPLTTPFVYTGVRSLAWELVTYSNTANGLTNAMDSEMGSGSTTPTVALSGAGCVASGQAGVMDLGVQHIDRGGTYQFGAYVTGAPANAPTVVFLGSTNPALSVPGLCGTVNTDLLIQMGVGVADAQGNIRELATATTPSYPAARFTWVLPNTFAGAMLHAQAHAIDLARPDPMQICNSNSRSWVVPTPNTTIVARASRLYNFQLQGPSYPNATPVSLGHAYGAVTEFTY